MLLIFTLINFRSGFIESVFNPASYYSCFPKRLGQAQLKQAVLSGTFWNISDGFNS